MSAGISSNGRVLVQYPAANGFNVQVYDSKTAAAIQLLREVIRNNGSFEVIQDVREEVEALLKHELNLLEEDE